jgi:hypothetical protein
MCAYFLLRYFAGSFQRRDRRARATIIDASKNAVFDLSGRFGANVLGTMVDDDLMVGPSTSWTWIAYILADVPTIAKVKEITTIIRGWKVGDDRLWRYVTIETRVGRPLFFGNS